MVEMIQMRAQSQVREASSGRGGDDSIGTRLDQVLSRTGNLESTVAVQSEKMDKTIADMFNAIKMMEKRSDQTFPISRPNSESSIPFRQGHSGTGSSYSGVTRLAKLDFPRFGGDKIKEWLFRVEQFFEIDRTPEDFKVSFVSIHLDGLASTWHQSLVNSEVGIEGFKDWKVYKRLLQDRFEVIDNPIAEFKQLQETDGIEDYHEKFVLVGARVNLAETDLVSAFISGLRTDMQLNIMMFQPQTVSQCLSIGRLYERAYPMKTTPIAELKQLQETNGIVEYHIKFELLRSRVNLCEEDLMNAFLAGLRTDTAINIRMFHPQTVEECLRIGRLYESVHPRKPSMQPLRTEKNKECMIQPRTFVSTEKMTKTEEQVGLVQADEELMGIKDNEVRSCLNSKHSFMFEDRNKEDRNDLQEGEDGILPLGTTLSTDEMNVAYGEKYVSNNEVRSDFLNSLPDALIEAKYVKTMEEYSKNHLASTLAYELFHSPRPPELFVAGRMIATKVEMEEDMNKDNQKQQGDWDYSFLLVAVANRRHIWSNGYHVWHRWKARYCFVGIISTMWAWLFGEGGFDIGK